MEDMTARAQELSEMAMALQKSAGRFKLSEDAQTGPSKLRTRRQNRVGEDIRIKKTAPRVKVGSTSKPKVPKKVDNALKKRGIDVKKEG
jgi:hypothetical protein